jgi:CheY-like chemotaxis protein
VITAANGPEALDIARGHTGDIHLLVTDVVMPRMRGTEVAEKVRAGTQRPLPRSFMTKGARQDRHLSGGLSGKQNRSDEEVAEWERQQAKLIVRRYSLTGDVA